jgi:hypothetical protein
MYETRSWQERPTWPFLLAVRSCTRSSQVARSKQARNDTSDNRDCKGEIGKKQEKNSNNYNKSNIFVSIWEGCNGYNDCCVSLIEK